VVSGLGIVSWIAFGALVGWTVGFLAGTDRRQGWLEHVAVGVAGAFVGGVAVGLLTGREVRFGWNGGSFVVATVGSLALLLILRLVRRAGALWRGRRSGHAGDAPRWGARDGGRGPG
jgi:uncharacterized membrane protein YeaQ/YmgE (transglycosylase-associated protein family)